MPGQSAYALAAARVGQSGSAYPGDWEIFEEVNRFGSGGLRPRFALEHVSSAFSYNAEGVDGRCSVGRPASS